MIKYYFVKFAPKIKKLTGCSRTTEILGKLEFWFSKMPHGFYKFIEPCSHRLYRGGDSWTEELDCDRKSFASSFDKIAVRYKSRRAYDEAEDKFQEKMYASFYDRNTNQTYFVRNHDLANRVLADIFSTKLRPAKKEDDTPIKASNFLLADPLRNGKRSRSYIEAKNTSNNLSKDKSHAEDIIKKMIEIWTALVEEGRGQIELTGKRIAFLRKAFVDKFDSCLEKWKKYCEDIASSRFLMGEVKDFRATLDWVLKFDNIQKIFEGSYGIGDRKPKTAITSQVSLQEEILNSSEMQGVKDFRTLCLETVGNAKYISYFKHLSVELREEGEIALIAPHKFAADNLERNCYSYLRIILQGLDNKLKNIIVLSPGETRGRLIERESRGGDVAPNLPPISTVDHLIPEEIITRQTISDENTLPSISLKTETLREKLRKTIPFKQFPSWLASIVVEKITEKGCLVVTFDDGGKVNRCEERFRQQILQAARSLWNYVDSVKIIKKQEEFVEFFEEKLVEFDETARLHQAIGALKGAHLAQNAGLI